jgi:uncharacterized protein YqeY
MALYKNIEDDMKAALKQGDALKLSTLRMLISSVRMLELEKQLKSIEDGDVIQILQKHAKQRKESIDQFTKGNRPELAEKEAKELKILEAYLPKQLSEEELMAVIRQAMTDTGASTKADMGKVMKAVTEKTRGKADGKVVSQLVAGLLK